MHSKRRKVRGHRTIALFSGAGRIVDDRYLTRVSSSDRSGKAIVCRVELLNGGFRPLGLLPAQRPVPLGTESGK
jgi:hypothetical protein